MLIKPIKKLSFKHLSRKNAKLVTFTILAISLVITPLIANKLSTIDSDDAQLNAHAAGNGWESGAACKVKDGGFTAWRGSPVTIAGTWNDASLAVQKEQWSIGNDYKYWTESMDNAIGAFWGSNWQTAASGGHDEYLRTALQAIDKGWGTKKTIYLRYGHEFNGSWFQWKVNASNNEAFKQAFAKFYNLVQTELVAKGRDAKVVWSPNNGEHNGINTELNWPGDQYVDVVGVDYYDWDVLNTQARWDSYFYKKGAYGGPYGVGAWQEFARKHGKPLSFPEWGTSGDGPIENPFFIQKMNEFMTANAGIGPGQVAYDVYFNCNWVKNGKQVFQIYPVADLPLTSEMYKSLKWGYSAIDVLPTVQVTAFPTDIPSVPTLQPTATAIPTPTPTKKPNPNPTPTPKKTVIPTATPTKRLTQKLTPKPTSTPAPNKKPTATPASTVSPITFQSSLTATNGLGSNTLVLYKPTSLIKGDIMIAQVTVHSSRTIITQPSGWKLIRSNQAAGSAKMATYYKFVGASEPASYTWKFSAIQPATGGVSGFRGVHATNPVQASSARYNNSIATVTFNQVTTSYPNGMILAFVSVTGNTTVTPPSGFSEIYDRNNTSSSNGKTVELSTQLKATAGLTAVGTGKEDTIKKSNLTQLVVLRSQ